MSTNMGKMTNTSHSRKTSTSNYMAVGMPVSRICPACKRDHYGKSNDACSKKKQQMHRNGEL